MPWAPQLLYKLTRNLKHAQHNLRCGRCWCRALGRHVSITGMFLGATGPGLTFRVCHSKTGSSSFQSTGLKAEPATCTSTWPAFGLGTGTSTSCSNLGLIFMLRLFFFFFFSVRSPAFIVVGNSEPINFAVKQLSMPDTAPSDVSTFSPECSDLAILHPSSEG